MTEYIVPYQDAESEFTEKRSRFITHLYKVETEAEARAEGQEQLLRQLQAMLDAGEGQLLRHSFDTARQGKWLVVTLRAECEEQIGVSSPLSTDGAE